MKRMKRMKRMRTGMDGMDGMDKMGCGFGCGAVGDFEQEGKEKREGNEPGDCRSTADERDARRSGIGGRDGWDG
ncbi:hypothetical protein OJ996_18100 [Luteolibacter sp. GHJ8]|uniref:Uncharacterized protein n=1 Tax=Luteolibacter rhizosphaerae TaxID=2989719 RepID=A0ABT3G7F8_9BACT|nr:hypothetical protein [Luteolibacter rhizosphaerae]MCW1915504.1 hypothetical protein [Luteolibacter rhizosphaerae]